MGKKSRNRSKPAQPAKPRRWPIIAAAIGIGLVCVGGVCAIALRHGNTSTADTAPAPAKPVNKTGMVLIPGGEFVMGTDDPKTMSNEHPAHRVKVDGFWMDEHDVTNAEFAQFVKATGYVTIAER